MSLPRERSSRPETAVISDPAELASLKPRWRALWQRCPTATPFQSPDWLIPWWDIFAPGELRIVTVTYNENVIGLAPLYRDGTRLLPIGISLSDYQDILLDPDFAEVAREEIGAAMAAMRDVEQCVFDEAAPEAAVLALASPSWRERIAIASPCPALPLPGSVQALKDVVPSSRLRHLRTARRRVARRGDSAILEGDVDNAVALLTELVRLHRLRWDFEQNPGVFSDPRVEAFHAAALPALIEEGLVRLYALAINDAVVGIYYGLKHGETAYAYLCGYDPDYAFESPGSVLIGHAIETAIGEGCTRFDFLRGDEAYKYDWGAQDRWNVRFILSKS